MRFADRLLNLLMYRTVSVGFAVQSKHNLDRRQYVFSVCKTWDFVNRLKFVYGKYCEVEGVSNTYSWCVYRPNNNSSKVIDFGLPSTRDRACTGPLTRSVNFKFLNIANLTFSNFMACRENVFLFSPSKLLNREHLVYFSKLHANRMFFLMYACESVDLQDPFCIRTLNFGILLIWSLVSGVNAVR